MQQRSNLADLALDQRVLVDVSRPDPSTTLFGQPMAMPMALGPIGIAGMTARRGEVQAARAAKAAGVLLGRAWVWALAAGGEAGVAHRLGLLRAELLTAMALTGRTRLPQGARIPKPRA